MNPTTIVCLFMIGAVAGLLVAMGRWFVVSTPTEKYGDCVNQYLSDFRNIILWKSDSELIQRQAIRCADGFTMSVQASASHYCSPRNDYGPWSAVEVGFPNRPEPLLEPHSDGYGDVFGWVPVAVVVQIIGRHGGLREEDASSRLARHGALLISRLSGGNTRGATDVKPAEDEQQVRHEELVEEVQKLVQALSLPRSRSRF